MLPRIMALEMASGGANMPAAAMMEFRRIFGVTRGILARGQEAGLLRPEVHAEYPLEGFREAMAEVRSRRAVGRVVLRP